MSDAPRATFLRMRDVALVVAEAARYKERLSKTQLQKNIYLVDAVTLLYELLPMRQGHQTYKHGPWDSAIQNAADSLVFRGLMKPATVRRGPQREVFVRYELTAAGARWAELLAESPVARRRARIVAEVARQVETQGWPRLRELVYAEPTYAFSRGQGYGQRLSVTDPESNSAANLLRLIARVIGQGWREEPPPDIVVRLFFEYLARYREVLAGEDLAVAEEL